MLTPQESTLLSERYLQGERTNALARAFGITPQGVAHHLKKHGVQPRLEHNAGSLDSNKLAEEYLSGASILSLATLHGVGQEAIRHRIVRAGLSVRSISENAKLCNPVNAGWLDVIDSPEKAWVAGWMATDGTIHDRGTRRGQRGVTLILQKRDRDVTKAFYGFLGGSFRDSKKLPRTEWCAYSDQLNDSFRRLGITPRKSKSLIVDLAQFPTGVYRDFVRGAVEGDGSIYRGSRAGQWGFSFCSGSETFLEQIRNLLPERLNINRRKHDGLLYISTAGRSRVVSILSWLYGTNATPTMYRKHALATTALSELGGNRGVCL